MQVFAPNWRRESPSLLPPDAIHLWAVDLHDFGRTERARRRCLSEAELARARRIAHPVQRARYLGGRAGMRMLLGAYTGLAGDALRLSRGPRGKPKLLDELPGGELCFNYSLSGRRALYALAWNRALGVDLETAPRAINTAGLARRILSAAERQTWRAVPAAERDAVMLAIWTRKEAYGKALGVGIRYQLRDAQVFAGDGARWRCQVGGLFRGETAAARALHGVQLAAPFAGVAALVYDGDVVAEADITARHTSLAALAEFSPVQKS